MSPPRASKSSQDASESIDDLRRQVHWLTQCNSHLQQELSSYQKENLSLIERNKLLVERLLEPQRNNEESARQGHEARTVCDDSSSVEVARLKEQLAIQDKRQELAEEQNKVFSRHLLMTVGEQAKHAFYSRRMAGTAIALLVKGSETPATNDVEEFLAKLETSERQHREDIAIYRRSTLSQSKKRKFESLDSGQSQPVTTNDSVPEATTGHSVSYLAMIAGRIFGPTTLGTAMLEQIRDSDNSTEHKDGPPDFPLQFEALEVKMEDHVSKNAELSQPSEHVPPKTKAESRG